MSQSLPRSRVLRLFRRHGFCWRLLNLICLGGWLISAEGAGPALCALFADLDAVHGVVVAAEPNGKAVVTLTHETAQEPMAPADAMPVAQPILNDGPTPLGQDHVLSFQPLDDSRLAKARKFQLPALLPLRTAAAAAMAELSGWQFLRPPPAMPAARFRSALSRVMRC